MTPEEQFQSELELIKRVTAWVCARRSLRGADAEDFASTVLERLIENNYAVRAKFQGRSSLKTYLTSVINRLYLDFQVQRFGKWRCSAEARRLGTLAVRLEQQLYRDGLTFSEACGVLQTDYRVTETREALYALSLKIPRRTRRTPRPGDDPEGAADPTPPTPADAAAQVEQRERQVLADRTFCALRRSLGRLPARDRILLRLHLEDGLTLADVARLLGEEQKSLYRRRDATYMKLRQDLLAEGIGVKDAQELLCTLDWDAALTTDTEVRPSFSQAGPDPSPSGGQSDPEGGGQ
jgi:RNA polymerase sigma factor for flagellar operon FliA